MPFKAKNAVAIAAGSILAVSFFADVNADYVLKYKRHTDQYTVSARPSPLPTRRRWPPRERPLPHRPERDTASSWGSTRTSCITSTTKRSNIRKFPSTPLTRRSTLPYRQKISLLHNRKCPPWWRDDEDDENGGHGNAYGAAEENRRLELHPVYGSATIMMSTSNSEIWATTDVKIDPEFYAKFLSAPDVQDAGVGKDHRGNEENQGRSRADNVHRIGHEHWNQIIRGIADVSETTRRRTCLKFPRL